MPATRHLRPTFLALVLAAVLPWATLFALNAALGSPPEGPDPQHCTRYCHGHGGCRHEPVLPALLASDAGLYGATIRGLFALGQGSFEGYGAANLLLFCVAWPGLMWALVGVAVWQRAELRELRGQLDDIERSA